MKKRDPLENLKGAMFVLGTGYGLALAAVALFLSLLTGEGSRSTEWIAIGSFAFTGAGCGILGSLALRKAERKFHSVTEEATG